MKTNLLLAASVSVVIGMILIQLRTMKKYHPNAELLVRLLKMIAPDSRVK